MPSLPLLPSLQDPPHHGAVHAPLVPRVNHHPLLPAALLMLTITVQHAVAAHVLCDVIVMSVAALHGVQWWGGGRGFGVQFSVATLFVVGVVPLLLAALVLVYLPVAVVQPAIIFYYIFMYIYIFLFIYIHIFLKPIRWFQFFSKTTVLQWYTESVTWSSYRFFRWAELH